MANESDRSSFAPLKAGIREDELAATLAILRAEVVPLESLSAELDQAGAVDTLHRFAEDSKVAAALAKVDVPSCVQEARQWLLDGRDVRLASDIEYPQNLSTIYNKPPMIFIKGAWMERRDSISVAVVGTRKPTDEGLKRARQAAKRLAGAGITVISGLAAGIDTAAHAAAMAAGGRTIAVMGTGIDRVYPTENRELAREIVSAGGALISQFLPDQPPTQWTFPMRNVTMSGLSLATFVIEAGLTSGARRQARHALEHGRTVFLAASLVSAHAWAAQMVEKGQYGAHAIPVDSIEEVIDRIAGLDVSPLASGW